MAGPGLDLFGEEEKKEVLNVLETGHLARYGASDDPRFMRKAFQLEETFAKEIGVDHCIAVNSGTSALMCCYAALGIGPGDEVIVPGYTFIASISSIIYSRAIPILAEVDESLTIDPRDIERKITKHTKAILPVHMLGNPCDMDAIMEIAKKHNLYVIEDCCQAAGAAYKGRKVGSMGHMAAFSLNVYKILTCGEGGLVTTNDQELFERAFAFHDQGHKPNRSGVEIGQRSYVGNNFRLTELNAAVALAQVRKLDKVLSMLRTKKKKLKDALKDLEGIQFRKLNDEEGECASLLTLLFENTESAKRFCAELGTSTLANSGWHVYNNMEQFLEKKMPTRFNCPFECPKYGQEVSYHKYMLPQTDDLVERAVNISIGIVDKGIGAGFGISVLSSDEEIEHVAEQIKAAYIKCGQGSVS